MTITTAFILIFFTVPFLKAKKTNSVSDLYPTRMQVAAELGFNFINSLLADTVGKEGKKYFPLVFTLFMFILFGNLFGMIPYSFTFTSHIIVTLALAMGVFIFVTVLGFVKHGAELVKEISKPRKLMSTMGCISNCLRGLSPLAMR